ncbi:MAG: zinc dependent phospholipase C family protein, partial [Minisyncoccia bacterium]
MPKENTHLYFADNICKEIDNGEFIKIIAKHRNLFYLGSFFPDVFFYSKHDRIKEFGHFIHGRDGNLTNELIFNLLDNAKDKKSEPDLIFTLGVLAHFALDITFHPIINYLSHDPSDYNRELYLHHHYETLLDSIVNGKFYFYKIINFKALN